MVSVRADEAHCRPTGSIVSGVTPHQHEDGRGAGAHGPEPDLTPLPDLVHGRRRAGPVRERRPVYVDLLPPCNNACPAGENIQGWLGHARVGKHEEAWRLLVADNPCAAICNRANLDSAVSIHAVERFLGDTAREHGWRFAPPAQASGKRVLIVGAGPSGLSAADHLARAGHQVEIRDAGAQPGGMMRYGIRTTGSRATCWTTKSTASPRSACESPAGTGSKTSPPNARWEVSTRRSSPSVPTWPSG